MEKLTEREGELSARDGDLRQIIDRHEQEIQRLASKGIPTLVSFFF